MFTDAAQDVGVSKWKHPKNKNQRKKCLENKMWFDAECKAARCEYLNIKNRIEEE